MLKIFEDYIKSHYDEYFKFLEMIAWKYQVSEADREDIVQEVMVKVLNNINSINLTGDYDHDTVALKRYSSTLMRNLSIDKYRSADNQRVDRTQSADEFAKGGENPESAASKSFAKEQLILFYNKHLNPEQTQIMHLKGMDYSAAKIGEILGLKTGTVYSKTHRAIEKLRPHRKELREILSNLRDESDE